MSVSRRLPDRLGNAAGSPAKDTICAYLCPPRPLPGGYGAHRSDTPADSISGHFPAVCGSGPRNPPALRDLCGDLREDV